MASPRFSVTVRSSPTYAGPFMMSRLGRHRPPIRIRYTLKIIGLQAEKDACEPDRNCIKLQYIATVEVSHEQ